MLKPHIDSGKLVVIGVVQEQHPDRAALYRQWRRIDWPIMVDTLNALGLKAVPIPVAIDEYGIVRSFGRPPDQFLDMFLASDEAGPVPDADRRTRAAVITTTEPAAQATASPSSGTWMNLGVRYFQDGRPDTLGKAIECFDKSVTLDDTNGPAHFRLGAALWRRSESDRAEARDAQRAIDHWTRALEIDPNQYIWRRRLQQYGPRLDKPYDFYTWVELARREIKARGDRPHALSVEPFGSELLPPPREGAAGQPGMMVNKDPHGKIARDTRKLVRIDSIVTPARVRPGHGVRVRVGFRLNDVQKPSWNNESDSLRVWVEIPDGFALREGAFEVANATVSETQEPRMLEFEVRVGDEASHGTIEVPAYALYYVCEGKGGRCKYLRQNFGITLDVDAGAPTLR